MERGASPDLLDFFWELAQDGDVYATDILAFENSTSDCIGADTFSTPLAAAPLPLDRQPSTVSTSTVLQPAPSWPGDVASPTPGDSLQRLVINQPGPVRRSSRGRASRQHAAPAPVSPSPALAASPVSVPRLLPPAAVPAFSLLAPPALLPGLQGQHQHSHATGGPPVDGGLTLGSTRSSSGTLRLPRLLPLAMLQEIDSAACAGAPAAAAGFALGPSNTFFPPPAHASTAPPGTAWAPAAAGALPCGVAGGEYWEAQATAAPGSTSTAHSFLQPQFAPGSSSLSPAASPDVGSLGTSDPTGGAGMATAALSSLGSSSSRKRSAALASPAPGGWLNGEVPALSGQGSNKRRTSMSGFAPAVPQPTHEVTVGASSPLLLAQQISDLDAARADLQHTLSGLYASWAAATQEPVLAQRQHSAAQGSRSAASPGVAAEQALAAHEEELLYQMMCFAAGAAGGGGSGCASYGF